MTGVVVESSATARGRAKCKNGGAWTRGEMEEVKDESFGVFEGSLMKFEED